MSWSAKDLSEGYPRVIIGFDLRAKEASMPASFDCSSWPSEAAFEFDFSNYGNGLNLSIAAEPLRLLNGSKGAILVAFDIPRNFAATISTTFGLCPLEMDGFLLASEWQFLGYDIVDVRTQSSALYGFDRNILSSDLIKTDDFELNKSGLISGSDAAIRLSILSDQELIEHAPFCPCGVWIEK